MNETEEPMEMDASLSFETDKLIDPGDSKISLNELCKPAIIDVNNTNQESRYENRGAAFTTGIDIFGEEEKLKMQERAKRFGLTKQTKNLIQEPELYTSLGIAAENDATKYLRLNVLHMRGTEEMSTKDVFKYFEDYAPASIEWINDMSCNVVWLDDVTAARALLRLSKRIHGICDKVEADKNIASEVDNFDEENNLANKECVIEVIGDDTMDCVEDKKIENSINIKDIKCPLPPGLWRKGVDCPKSKNILLRFAARSDKKQPNAEKMSDYYRKYGNPNFGGIRGILTESRKRMFKELRHGKKRSKSEVSGIDETKQKNTRNPWGSLSQSWGVNDFMEDEFLSGITPPLKDQGTSVKERLGFTPAAKFDSGESENSSDTERNEEWCKRSKVMRMRMHADDEEAKVQKRRLLIKNQVASIGTSRSNDLRSRLGNPRPPPAVFRDTIQVVVANSRMGASHSPNDTRSEVKKHTTNLQEEPAVGEEDEEEEGEIVDDDKETIENLQDESWGGHDNQSNEDEEEEEDSDESEKEVQGPRGSVIKVVQHKPRVASTVWARLNHKRPEESETLKHRRETKGDLRETLRGDLRSRLGKQTRGRSPLRIEVKNDKYANDDSDSE